MAHKVKIRVSRESVQELFPGDYVTEEEFATAAKSLGYYFEFERARNRIAEEIRERRALERSSRPTVAELLEEMEGCLFQILQVELPKLTQMDASVDQIFLESTRLDEIHSALQEWEDEQDD